MDQTNAPAVWAQPQRLAMLMPVSPIFQARALCFLLIKELLSRGEVPSLREDAQMPSGGEKVLVCMD